VDHAAKERQRFAVEMQLDRYFSKHTWSDIQEIHDDNNREEEEEGNNSAPEDVCIYICYSLIQSLINTIQLS
jgi:hypothetical protein